MSKMSQGRINVDLFNEVSRLKAVVKGLEDSLRIYKEDNDKYEKSTHIEDFLYEINVNEKGEIPCQIEANGVEHSFVITEDDVRRFAYIFQMHKTK